MIDRIVDLFWRARYRLAKWRSRPRAKSYREQCERNGWFVAALVCLSLTAHACGPTTSEVLDRQRAIFAECGRRLDAIESMDAPAEERLRLFDAEGSRCRVEMLAHCHHYDTCGEYGQ